MNIKYYKFILLGLVVFFCNITKINAKHTDLDIISIDTTFTEISLEGKIKLYRNIQNLTISEFWNNKQKLQQLDSDNFYPGFSEGFYWLVIKIKSSDNFPHKVILEINNPQLDTVNLYEIKSESVIELLDKNGDEQLFALRKTPFEVPAFSLFIVPEQTKTYVVKMTKRKSIKFPAKLYAYNVYLNKSHAKSLFYGFYFGSIFLVFLGAMVIGLFLKNKVLFAYSLYVLSVGWFIFSDSGYAFQFLYPNNTFIHSEIRTLTSIVGLSLFIIFSNLFIETKKTYPQIIKIFNISIFLWFSLFIVITLTPFLHQNIYRNQFLLYAHYFFLFGLLIFMLITSVLQYKHNKRNVKIYWSALLVFGGGIIVFLIQHMGFLKDTICQYHPIIYASMGEFLIFSFALFFNIRKINNERNELLVKTAKQTQKILIAQINGAENASKRISNELHDNIGSRLALLKNKILYKNIDIVEMSQDIGGIYNDVRNISHRLSPGIFQMIGCKGAIKEYLHEVNLNTQSGIKTHFYCDAKEINVGKDIAFQVFRIVQETVLNCVKHAGKADVYVKIIHSEKNLLINIDDNGKGFDTNNPKLISGIGIQNIKMRVKMLNGKFTISSQPGKGTSVSVIIPTNKK